MKKRICLLLICLALLVTLPGCGSSNTAVSERKSIVATLFPHYDFARAIVGDKMDVIMVLPSGIEGHSFEPTPQDIINIANADIFVYTGDFMEPWAAEILSGTDNKNLNIVELSASLGAGIIANEHEDEAIHEFLDEHGHGFDPHIWLDMTIAVGMVEDILDAVIALDPENEAFYTANAEDYIAQLEELDQQFIDISFGCERPIMAFGGRFAYAYFVRRYFLDYEAAYRSCSADAEASVQNVANLIEFIKDNDIPYIFHEELTEPKLAVSVAEQTGAELLQFNVAHNVSKDDFDRGVTFIDLMKQNVENLEVGLN